MTPHDGSPRVRNEVGARSLPAWWTILAIVAAGGAVGRVLVPGENPVLLLVALAAVALAAIGGVALRPRGDRLVAALLALGVLLTAIGGALIRLGVDGPGNLGGWSWALGTVPLLMALGIVVARTQASSGIGALLDTLTVVVVSLLVFWNITIHAILNEASGRFELLAPQLFHLACGAVLVGLVLRLAAHPTGRRFLSPWLVLGALPIAVTAVGTGLAQLGDWRELSDIGYLVGLLGLARAVVDSPTPGLNVTDAADVPDGTRVGWVLVSMVAPLAVPPLLVLLDEYQGRPISLWEPITGLLLLLLIAYLRVGWTLRQLYLARLEVSAARDAAMDASRAKSAFLATMSHEIRTPMNGVIGLARLLEDTDLSARQRHYAEGITTAGKSLLAVINDILDFSRGEAGRLYLEHVEFDLRSVVDEVEELLGCSAQGKGLELRTRCADELPARFRGDPVRLRQLLVNLVGNAVKFTEEGVVTVGVRPIGQEGGTGFVRIEVADTGIGIPEATRDVLFLPFHQADSSTSRRFGGSGLGLAISHQLVVAMGGTISAHSSPGLGSTFRVELPLELVEGPPRRTTSESGLAGHRVLLAAHRERHRADAEDRLRSWGIEPDLADSVDQVRARLADGTPYSAILVDPELPGLGENGAAERIRDAGTPVLVLGPETGRYADSSWTVPDALVPARTVPPEELADALTDVFARPQPEPPDDSQVDVLRGRVLLVEDDPINQLVARGMVQRLGYQAEAVADGAAALDLLAGETFDVVLMDCHMPVLDGFETTRRWRESEAGGHLPIIAMTASIMPEDRQRCADVGMDDFVAKPVGLEQLDRALSRWVGQARAGRE